MLAGAARSTQIVISGEAPIGSVRTRMKRVPCDLMTSCVRCAFSAIVANWILPWERHAAMFPARETRTSSEVVPGARCSYASVKASISRPQPRLSCCNVAAQATFDNRVCSTGDRVWVGCLPCALSEFSDLLIFGTATYPKLERRESGL